MNSPGDRSRWARSLRVIGVVLYVATGWLYLGSGLVVPAPWFYGFWAAWVAGLVVLARVAGRSPSRTPVVAAGAVAGWAAAVSIGSWLLGWTA